MNYKYEIVNYDKNIPAKILYCNLSSETHKTELHWHREPEIVYVLEGLGECSHNGEVMDPGNVKFLTAKMCIWFVLKWDIMRI